MAQALSGSRTIVAPSRPWRRPCRRALGRPLAPTLRAQRAPPFSSRGCPGALRRKSPRTFLSPPRALARLRLVKALAFLFGGGGPSQGAGRAREPEWDTPPGRFPPSLAPLATELPPPFLRALLLDLRAGALPHGLARVPPRLLNGYLPLARHAGNVPGLNRLPLLLGRGRVGDGKGTHGSEPRVRVLLALVACGDRGCPPVPPRGVATLPALNCVSDRDRRSSSASGVVLLRAASATPGAFMCRQGAVFSR